MTRLLLDSHAVLWFFWDDPQIGRCVADAPYSNPELP
jgi:PIN domain nuclease of toxin-antitoxin system